MRRLLVLLAAGLLLAGCGGGDSSPGPGTTTAEEAATTVEGIRVLETIAVHETEYALEPRRITVDRLGYYGIRAVNDGQETHALEVKGHGVDEKTGDIAPGESKTFAVLLTRSGRYELYCPIDDHAQKGMKGTITAP